MVSRVAGEETGKDRLLGKNQLEGSCALSQFFGARRLLDMRRILGTRRFFGSPRVGNAKAAVQNNFSKTFALPVLSCGEFASDFRDSQGYTAFCTVQLNKKVILDRRLTDAESAVPWVCLSLKIPNPPAWMPLGLARTGWSLEFSRYTPQKMDIPRWQDV